MLLTLTSALTPKPDGKVLVHTPYDPRTCKRGLLLDGLELIRRLCAQIPAPRQHMVRYLGWNSSRARGERAKRNVSTLAAPLARDDSPQAAARRRSWARLIRRIFEVEPLLCSRCKVEM